MISLYNSLCCENYFSRDFRIEHNSNEISDKKFLGRSNLPDSIFQYKFSKEIKNYLHKVSLLLFPISYNTPNHNMNQVT